MRLVAENASLDLLLALAANVPWLQRVPGHADIAARFAVFIFPECATCLLGGAVAVQSKAAPAVERERLSPPVVCIGLQSVSLSVHDKLHHEHGLSLGLIGHVYDARAVLTSFDRFSGLGTQEKRLRTLWSATAVCTLRVYNWVIMKQIMAAAVVQVHGVSGVESRKAGRRVAVDAEHACGGIHSDVFRWVCPMKASHVAFESLL
jgi:hypothetical protein